MGLILSGTVNISRDLFDHPAFKAAPFSEREAWLWIIMEASWKPRQKRIGHIVVEVGRGQLAASIRFMAEAWGWTAAKVQRFVERLKKLEMISIKTDTGLTLLTVCNYDKFQAQSKAADTAAIQDRYTSDTNEKKGVIREEGKKEDMGKPISPAVKPPDKMRLPADWALSDEGWAYARSQAIPDEVIRDEAAGFHAYWTDRRDRDAKKSERGWEQCWANRCRSIAGRYAGRGMAGQTNPGRHGQGSSIASIAARRWAAGEA